VPAAYISADIGWHQKKVEAALASLEYDGFLVRRESWVAITEYLKWNEINNKNQATNAGNLALQIRHEDLKVIIAEQLDKHVKNMPEHLSKQAIEPFRRAFEGRSKAYRSKEKEKEKEKEQDQEKEKHIYRPAAAQIQKTNPVIQRVVEYYRSVNPTKGKHLKPAHKDWRLIQARLDDGFTEEDLCRAVDGNRVDIWHRERKAHSVEYIFRNATKVETFIEKARAGDRRPPVSKNDIAMEQALEAAEEYNERIRERNAAMVRGENDLAFQPVPRLKD
jgi:hypothetical protein